MTDERKKKKKRPDEPVEHGAEEVRPLSEDTHTEADGDILFTAGGNTESRPAIELPDPVEGSDETDPAPDVPDTSTDPVSDEFVPFSGPDADTDSSDEFTDLGTPTPPYKLPSKIGEDGDESATIDHTQTDMMPVVFGRPAEDGPETERVPEDQTVAFPDDPASGTQTDMMPMSFGRGTDTEHERYAPAEDQTADLPVDDPRTDDLPADEPEDTSGTHSDILQPFDDHTRTRLAAPDDRTADLAPEDAAGDSARVAAPDDRTDDYSGPFAPADDEPDEPGHTIVDLPDLSQAPLFAPAPDRFEGRDAPAPEEPAAAPDDDEPKLPWRQRVRDRLRGAWEGTKTAYATWKTRPKAKAPKPDLKLERTAAWWRKTLTEIGLLYSIVIPIELAVSGGQIGAFGVHPHPYWLIILPMAAARGVVAGLFAATIGSILFTIGAFLELGEAAKVFTYGAMVEPILFFAVGFFAGELRDELASRYRKLQRRLADVEERAKRLRQERDVLTDANRELEKRIVDHSVQFGNMIVAATRIERSGRTEVFEIALDLVEEHCGAAASIVLILEDSSLDYLCHRGWPDEQTADRIAATRASEFVARAIRAGEPVNGFAAEETAPEAGPLVVAPLFDHSGVVKALLCLDEIPASHLNESTITIFLGIAEWVSASLGRLASTPAADVKPPPSLPALPDGGAWLGRPEELGERLRVELSRCTRYGVPASFLCIQASEWTDTSVTGADVIDRFILTHFTGGLRPSDELFRFGYPGCYLLVLAGTTIQGAEVVRTRLLRRVEYSPSQRVGRIEIFATGPDAEAPDLASLVDRVAARFRAQTTLPLDGKCPVIIPEAMTEGTVDQFIRRLRMETSLAIRNSFSLHVIGITAESTDGSILTNLARHVREAGQRTLRPTDGVYMIGPHDCSVILPCTDSSEAATVAHRLVTSVRERDPDAPYGDLRTNVLSLGSAHPDAESFLQALARSRRQEAP